MPIKKQVEEMNKKNLIITYFMSLLSYEVKADSPWDPRKYMETSKNNYAKIALGHNFAVNSKFGDFKNANNSIVNMAEFAIGQNNFFGNNLNDTPLRMEISFYIANRGMAYKENKTSVTERYKKSFNSSQNSLTKNEDHQDVDKDSNKKANETKAGQNQDASGEIFTGKDPHLKTSQNFISDNKTNSDQSSDRVKEEKNQNQTSQNSKSKNYLIEKEKTGTAEIKKTLHVKTTSLMLKAYWDMDKFNQITPFIGAGIGIANHDFSGDVGKSSNTVNLAWGVEGGLSLSMTPRAKFDLSYGYTNMGRVKLSGEQLPIKSHQAKVGLRYYF